MNMMPRSSNRRCFWGSFGCCWFWVLGLCWHHPALHGPWGSHGGHHARSGLGQAELPSRTESRTSNDETGEVKNASFWLILSFKICVGKCSMNLIHLKVKTGVFLIWELAVAFWKPLVFVPRSAVWGDQTDYGEYNLLGLEFLASRSASQSSSPIRFIKKMVPKFARLPHVVPTFFWSDHVKCMFFDTSFVEGWRLWSPTGSSAWQSPGVHGYAPRPSRLSRRRSLYGCATGCFSNWKSHSKVSQNVPYDKLGGNSNAAGQQSQPRIASDISWAVTSESFCRINGFFFPRPCLYAMLPPTLSLTRRKTWWKQHATGPKKITPKKNCSIAQLSATAQGTLMFTHRNPEALGGGEFFGRVAFRIIHRSLAPRQAIEEVAAEMSSWFKQKASGSSVVFWTFGLGYDNLGKKRQQAAFLDQWKVVHHFWSVCIAEAKQGIAKFEEATDPTKPLSKEETAVWKFFQKKGSCA